MKPYLWNPIQKPYYETLYKKKSQYVLWHKNDKEYDQ